MTTAGWRGKQSQGPCNGTTGYRPEDYPTQSEWDARLLLESSLAIKCPSIAYHLLTTKKLQQVFEDPIILKHYLPDGEEASLALSCMAKMVAFDQPLPDGSYPPVTEAMKQVIGHIWGSTAAVLDPFG